MGLYKSDLGAGVTWPPPLEGGGRIPELLLRRILRLAAGHTRGGTPYLAVFSPQGHHLVGRRGPPPESIRSIVASIPAEPQRVVEDLRSVAENAGIDWRARFSSCAVFPILGGDGSVRGGLYVFFRPGRRLDAGAERAFRDVAGLVESCLEFVSGGGTTMPPGAAGFPRIQHHLRPLFENTSDIVFTQDLSGKFTAVNSVAERLLGYSQAELLEMRLADLVPETQRAQAEQILLEQFGGGSSQTYELQLLARDGKAVAMEVTVHLLFRHGLPAGLIGFARDITPRKAEQAARQEAERRLARLEAELAELSGYWARLHELTQARLPTFEAFAQRCLQAGCEALGLPFAFLAEQPAGSRPVVRAVHPAGALETGAAPPPHLLGLCQAPAADASAGLPSMPAIVAPVTAAGRAWGFLSFTGEDGRSPASLDARRFAEFLASLIGARLAEGRSAEAPAGTPSGESSARRALARLDELIRTMRGEKRVCSLILIESPTAPAPEEQAAALERCLNGLAGRLAVGRSLKHSYEVLRFGPHRWLLLLPRLGRRSDLHTLARCIESALAETLPERRPGGSRGPLCGVAILPQDGTDAASLVRAAEADLESGRAEAPDSVLTAGDSSGQRSAADAQLFRQLRRAFEQRQFHLRFQPQIQIDGELLGFEALLVWQHPVLGPIPASEFIAAVERSGLIVPLGSWVLDEACRIAAEWRRAGHDFHKIAVNVSAPQFHHPEFIDSVIGAIERHGLEPHLLELEVTERIAMGDARHAARILRRLRELGVRVAIDDFGTGYSSLSYLTRLPVDTLKIDRSFLSDETSEATARSTIEAIVALAHKLGLIVVGEGVEKVKHWQMLGEAGCDSVQGHLFGHPLPPEAAARLLENRSRRGRK